MAKRRPDGRSSLEKTAAKLERRFAEVENLARENKGTLELQFKRIAAIQANLDRIIDYLKENG